LRKREAKSVVGFPFSRAKTSPVNAQNSGKWTWTFGLGYIELQVLLSNVREFDSAFKLHSFGDYQICRLGVKSDE
jgi:hypothetical protein